MGKTNKINLNEEQLKNIVKESVKQVIETLIESDRHRKGYYDDYAEKTGKKDRHSPDYYKNYREKKKQEKDSQNSNNSDIPKATKKKSRKEYYRKYNLEHPERLERGYTKGYVDGNVSQGKENSTVFFDSLGRVRSRDFFNPTFTDLLDYKVNCEWHDDDWEESCWDD